MMGNHNSSESINKRSHCYGMCGGKSRGAFWGIVFIVVGLFWFGKEANWFSSEIMTLFWPFLFILSGICFIAAALTNKRDHHQNE